MVGYGTVNCKKVSKTALIIVACFCLTTIFTCFLFRGKEKASVAAGGSSSIIMEATTKRVLGGANVDARLPMASTTKAMTALVVIENCDLEAVVTIPKAAVGIEGSSIYLKEGEKLTVKELLYGLMLRSGNDAATALAIHAGGSLEGFVKLMNDKAAAMGLKNTHFVNPHGLHDPDHYTSAYDLGVIASEGICNGVFKEICSAKHVKIGAQSESARDLYNKNKILSTYSGGNGIKTGFTKDSGRCLIASSERDGMQVVAVVLNCYDMFAACANMMDNAHENYSMQKVWDKTAPVCEIAVVDGKNSDSAALYAHNDLYYPLKKDGSETVTVNREVSETVAAPHKKQEELGKIEILLDNHLIFSQKVYTMEDIEKSNVFDKIKDFLGRKNDKN